MSEHSEDCAIHGCEGWNGPRFCDCGISPNGESVQSSETFRKHEQGEKVNKPTSPARVPEEREKPKDWPAWACQKCWCNAGDDCKCDCHTSRPTPTPELEEAVMEHVAWIARHYRGMAEQAKDDPRMNSFYIGKVDAAESIIAFRDSELRRILAHKWEQ